MRARRGCAASAALLLAVLLPSASAVEEIILGGDPVNDVDVSKNVMKVNAETGDIEEGGFPVPNCNKVALFKTHKTGSSTWNNIIIRIAGWQDWRMQPVQEGWHDHYFNVSRALEDGWDEGLPADASARHAHMYDSVEQLASAWARVFGTHDYTLIVPVREWESHYFSHKHYFARDKTMEEHLAGCLNNPRAKNSDAFKHITGGMEIGDCWNPMAYFDFRITNEDELTRFISSALFKRMLFVPIDKISLTLASLAQVCDWKLHEVVYSAINRSGGSSTPDNPRSLLDAGGAPLPHGMVDVIYEFTQLDRKLWAAMASKYDRDIAALTAGSPSLKLHLQLQANILDAVAEVVHHDCKAFYQCRGRLSAQTPARVEATRRDCGHHVRTPFDTLEGMEAVAQWNETCEWLQPTSGWADIVFEERYSWEATRNHVPLPFDRALFQAYFASVFDRIRTDIEGMKWK